MAAHVSVGCLLCGLTRKLQFLGLRDDGSYDPEARPPKLTLYRHIYGGRANIRVEKSDVPAAIALGIRAAMKAGVARIEADLMAAGVEFED